MARERCIRRLKERDGDFCHYCKKPFDAGAYALTLDHKLPLSRGGVGADDNLVLAHRICNSLKGNTPYEEFVDRVLPRIQIAQITKRSFAQVKLRSGTGLRRVSPTEDYYQWLVDNCFV